MTIRDPFSKLVCKYVWHIRPWKGLVILLLGTIVQLLHRFKSIHFQIRESLNQHNFLFVPFSTRFVYDFFFLWSCYSVLWYWPLIILRYLRCIKKARSWHIIFFSIHYSIVCIVVFNWRSILSHLLTKLIAEVIEWNNCFIRKMGADWLFKCMYTTKKQHILI